MYDGRLPSRALPWLDRVGLGADRILGGVDVLHWTDYTTLPAGRTPVVATIHDVLFHDLPACYTPDMFDGLTRVTRRIVDAAVTLIVPSERTRDGLLRHYAVSPDRIVVVPHGPRCLPHTEPGAAGEADVEPFAPYVLAVGTLEPRKNLARLIQAVEIARERVPDLVLFIAGEVGWLVDDVLEAIAARAWVKSAPAPKALLASLYRHARIVAYPSLGEGFGLPVLEALELGRPLLVGADTPCADVAGGAALAVDPNDVDALADGIVRLHEDEALRSRLETEGPVRAATFSWEAAARRTHEVYASAMHADATARETAEAISPRPGTP